jgi:hypothetical protein
VKLIFSSKALCGTMGRYQKRWKLHFGHALVPVINEQAKGVAHRTQTFHAVFPDSHPATALGLQMPDLSDTPFRHRSIQQTPNRFNPHVVSLVEVLA